LEEDNEEAPTIRSRGIWDHWQSPGWKNEDDVCSYSSSRGGSSSRYLVHTASGTSCGSTYGTDSQCASRVGFGGVTCGSALLIHADSGASCGSSHSPLVERAFSGSWTAGNGAFERPMGLDSSGSTYFESEAGRSAVTDCSSPRSSRVIGRAPPSPRPDFRDLSDHDSGASTEDLSSEQRRANDAQADATAEAMRSREVRERARLRCLARWVGHRVQLSAAEVEAYARVLEENGFQQRDRLRELTSSAAEELGLPRRFASVLRREALLGLPAERKFGPLPPALEVQEEDEASTPPEESVEVCIMYEGTRGVFKPSTHTTNGFPTQLRDYRPSQAPVTPRGSCNRSLSNDRSGISRESLAHRAHLKRQESGRRAHQHDLHLAGLSKGRPGETQPDAWLASSFNHRSGRAIMPKARARSVAGFERPRGCQEMSAEIAYTVPDKDEGRRTSRRDPDTPPPDHSPLTSTPEGTPPYGRGGDAEIPQAAPAAALAGLRSADPPSSKEERPEVLRQISSASRPSASPVFANFRMAQQANANGPLNALHSGPLNGVHMRAATPQHVCSSSEKKDMVIKSVDVAAVPFPQVATAATPRTMTPNARVYSTIAAARSSTPVQTFAPPVRPLDGCSLGTAQSAQPQFVAPGTQFSAQPQFAAPGGLTAVSQNLWSSQRPEQTFQSRMQNHSFH